MQSLSIATLWICIFLTYLHQVVVSDTKATTSSVALKASSLASSQPSSRLSPLALPNNTMTSSDNNTTTTTTTNRKDDLTAIVIGAGPSGLATSIGLSKICKRVCLVEKHESFQNRGSTFGMSPNGLKALDELHPGLRNEMEQNGLRSNDSLILIWWEMRNCLLNCARRIDNIDIYTGEQYTEIRLEHETGGGGEQQPLQPQQPQQNSNEPCAVVVNFQSGLELAGDLVVGADGVHSDVRNTLGCPPPLISDTTNFRGSLIVPDSASPELRQLLNKGRAPLFVADGKEMYFVLFNFHERHPGRLAWILATSLDVPSDQTVTPFTIARAHVKDHDRLKLIEEIFHLSDKEHLEPYPKTSIIDFSDTALSSMDGGGWGGKGSVTLVGDAAHGMRPTDGFGGGMALEDAVVLYRSLKEWDGAESMSSLLRRFESSRIPRVKRVYDNQGERYNQRMVQGKRLPPLEKEFLDWLFAGV